MTIVLSGHSCMDDLLQAQVQTFVSNASLKKARRDIDKAITLNVQQISGTRQQVSGNGQPCAMTVLSPFQPRICGMTFICWMCHHILMW